VYLATISTHQEVLASFATKMLLRRERKHETSVHSAEGIILRVSLRIEGFQLQRKEACVCPTIAVGNTGSGGDYAIKCTDLSVLFGVTGAAYVDGAATEDSNAIALKVTVNCVKSYQAGSDFRNFSHNLSAAETYDR
jgi:hypothetical protein